jgi:hypothetical protein
MLTTTTTSAIRWTARFGSVASLLVLAAFIFGDTERGVSPTALEWLGIAFFPGGVIVGMLLAWRKELLGGAITAASLLGFYAWHFSVSGKLSAGPWFILLAAPGILFLVASLTERWERRWSS